MIITLHIDFVALVYPCWLVVDEAKRDGRGSFWTNVCPENDWGAPDCTEGCTGWIGWFGLGSIEIEMGWIFEKLDATTLLMAPATVKKKHATRPFILTICCCLIVLLTSHLRVYVKYFFDKNLYLINVNHFTFSSIRMIVLREGRDQSGNASHKDQSDRKLHLSFQFILKL